MSETKKILLNEKISIFIDLLMIGLGIFGIIGGLVYALYFPPETIIASYILIGIGLYLYYIHYQKKRSFLYFAFIIELCVFVFSVIIYGSELKLLFDALLSVIKHDFFLKFDSLIVNFNENYLLFITLIVFVGMPIVTLIISIVTKGKLIFLKLMIILLLMIFPVLIRHEISTYTSYCVVLFILYEYVFSGSLRLQKNNTLTKSIVLITMTIVLVFSNLFLEKNPLFKENLSSVLSQISNWIDDSRFQNSDHQQTGISSAVNGTLPTGSVKLNNGVALTITSPVSMNSYIRGYSLAHYKNNEWHPVNNDYTGANSLQFFGEYIYKDIPNENNFDVKIESAKKTTYQFLPYYSMYEGRVYDDSYYKQNSELVKVLYDENQSFDNRELKTKGDSYYEYTQYAKEEYMEVPRTLKDKLKEFLMSEYKEEYTMLLSSYNSIESKVNLIKKILNNETKYNLNAGDLPSGKDFVEYFLFESRKGSCTHYATTAALMLRCFDIPTRYTSGFIMQKSDFNNGVAQIKNSRAHAWIEVYYAGVGWFPYEVTPSSGGVTQSIESMVDTLDQNLNIQEKQTPQTNEQPNTPTPPTQSPSQTQENWYDFIVENSFYFISGLILILIVLLYRIITRKIFFIRMRKKNANEKIVLYYQRMLKLTRFGKEIDSTIHDLTLKAQFSQYTLDTEVESVKKYYDELNHDIYHELNWYKKFVYKYIFGYI